MKKLFVTVAVAVMVGLTSFAADITKVSSKVRTAFEKEFTTATNVSWELLKGENIYHASFVYSGEVMEAYYSTDGEMIAAARHISEAKLPLLVNKSLKENFGQYSVKQISEYMTTESTSYIVSLESEKVTMVTRIYSSGSHEVLKRTKK